MGFLPLPQGCCTHPLRGETGMSATILMSAALVAAVALWVYYTLWLVVTVRGPRGRGAVGGRRGFSRRGVVLHSRSFLLRTRSTCGSPRACMQVPFDTGGGTRDHAYQDDSPAPTSSCSAHWRRGCGAGVVVRALPAGHGEGGRQGSRRLLWSLLLLSHKGSQKAAAAKSK